METIVEIQKLYEAYIRSDVSHQKTIQGLCKEYTTELVYKALGIRE